MITKEEKADIVKKYNAIKREELDDNVGQIECYTCTKCGRVTKTQVQNKGFIPRGIICPKCGEDAMSSDFEDIVPKKEVEYVWRTPSLKDVLALYDRPFQCNFLLSGGLKRVKV